MHLVASLVRPHVRAASPAMHAARLLLAATCMLALLAAGAGTARAAYTLTTNEGWTVQEIAGGCHTLGSSDSNGVFYTTCGARILRYDRNGTRLADIALPAGLNGPRDVAPSPDGAFLYVTQGGQTPRRLNRQADGSYALDADWRMQKFSVWNVEWTPVGHSIATDGRGDIYLSNSSFWVYNTQNSIAKFRPDGSSITAFGDYGKEDGNWITNQDLAVSRDGRRVFVGENCGKSCNYASPDYQGSRVTRYDFTPGGTYRFTRVVSAQGPMDGNPFPRCESAGATHSAYSLSLDFWENLYVTSTTCGRLQMFDTDPNPANDRFLRSVAVYVDPATANGIDGRRNHYVASDWAGRLYTSEWQRLFTPKVIRLPQVPLPALAPLPEPDIEAPRVNSVTLPATTTAQDVEIAIEATDNQAVAELQLAREDGNWGPWQPFATPVSYRLSDGYGVKGVYLRVRDMAGNESAAVYRTLGYQAPAAGDDPAAPPPPAGDVADPVLSSVTIPALTATREVAVTIEATDDVQLRHVRLANEDGNWAPWQAYADTVTWTLSAGEGGKAVYVQVRDGAGRESTTILSRTRYQLDAPPPPPDGGGGQPDTVAPELTALTLPAETTTQRVDARLVATDAVGVAQVRFANEDGTWTAWQAWADTKAWMLTANYGAKLVYAQVRDAAGNESLVLNARTTYVRAAAGPADAADPTLTAVRVPETTRTQQVTVGLDAADDIGVAHVRFANEDGTWQEWKPFAADVQHMLTAGTGMKAVYVQVRDAAGRESNVMFVRTQVIA